MSAPAVEALHRALYHATEYIGGLDERSVAATVRLEELRARLGGTLPTEGTDPARVIDELVANTVGGHLGYASGRFFAWVSGGSLTAALAADWLTATWDQNAALYACGPAAAVVEEIAGTWLKDLLGLPPEASFAFTTGCQLAHFTCLAAARHAVLRDAGWDINTNGLFGAPSVSVITSDQRHASVDRAVRFLGFGKRNLITIPAQENGQIDPGAFQAELAGDASPTIVVLNAADLNIAAFDAFDQLIPAAKAAGAWVHVDGAFGLFARASSSTRRLL